MFNDLRQEIKKLTPLSYPITLHDLLYYFSSNNFIDFAFIKNENNLYLLMLRDIIPLMLSCQNGQLCSNYLPTYFSKEPIQVDLNKNEKEIFLSFQEAIEKEEPVVITQNNAVLGFVSYKQLLFFLKKCEVKEAMFLNPLTGLPGNYQIQKAYFLKKEPFIMAYVDINNFKPFNDKYGVAVGDAVIKFCGDFMKTEGSKYFKDYFVGHVGGDDFILLIENIDLKSLKQFLVDLNYDLKNFHSDKEKQQGFMTALDRYGNIVNFPLLSCSIGAVFVENKINYKEITSKLAELKKIAKMKLTQNDLPLVVDSKYEINNI